MKGWGWSSGLGCLLLRQAGVGVSIFGLTPQQTTNNKQEGCLDKNDSFQTVQGGVSRMQFAGVLLHTRLHIMDNCSKGFMTHFPWINSIGGKTRKWEDATRSVSRGAADYKSGAHNWRRGGSQVTWPAECVWNKPNIRIANPSEKSFRWRSVFLHAGSKSDDGIDGLISLHYYVVTK